MYDISYMYQPVRDLLGRVLGRIHGVAPPQSELQTSPVSDTFSLGDILIASGQITRGQLNAALEQQKHSVKKLGELLVERGYAQQNQVDQGLHIQHILVSAALVTIVALYPPAKADAGSSTAGFQATASVKKVARITVMHQLPQMVITREDIVQGYLEVPAASRLEVRNSSLAGYMIAFEVQEGPFRHVVVRGLGTELQISFGSGWLLMPHSRMPETLELTYRFILSADARPGSYPWPIHISALAI